MLILYKTLSVTLNILKTNFDFVPPIFNSTIGNNMTHPHLFIKVRLHMHTRTQIHT